MTNFGFQFLNWKLYRVLLPPQAAEQVQIRVRIVLTAASLSQNLSQSGYCKSKEPYKYRLLWVIIVFHAKKQYII